MNYVVIRKIVKQASGIYTITIPKDIVEAKKWENTKFEITIDKNKIILKRL